MGSVNNLYRFYTSDLPKMLIVDGITSKPVKFHYITNRFKYNLSNLMISVKSLNKSKLNKYDLVCNYFMNTPPNIMDKDNHGAIYYAILDNNIDMLLNILLNTWIQIDFTHNINKQFIDIINSSKDSSSFISDVLNCIIKSYFTSERDCTQQANYMADKLKYDVVDKIINQFGNENDMQMYSRNNVITLMSIINRTNGMGKRVIQYYIDTFIENKYRTNKNKIHKYIKYLSPELLSNLINNFTNIYPTPFTDHNIRDMNLDGLDINEDISEILLLYADVYLYKFQYENSIRFLNSQYDKLHKNQKKLRKLINKKIPSIFKNGIVPTNIKELTNFNFLIKLYTIIENIEIYKMNNIESIYKITLNKKQNKYIAANKKLMANKYVKEWSSKKTYPQKKYLINIEKNDDIKLSLDDEQIYLSKKYNKLIPDVLLDNINDEIMREIDNMYL